MTRPSRLRQFTVISLFVCGLVPVHARMARAQALAEEAAPADVWNDALTSLTWIARDNGKDVSWKGAVSYCRKLRLGGYVDWRLANSSELQSIYDKTVETAGRAGDTKGGIPRDVTWHVKGNLHLTGREWSYDRGSRKGKPTGYAEHFDFNEGRLDNDPFGWPYPYNGLRALCVRGAAGRGAAR